MKEKGKVYFCIHKWISVKSEGNLINKKEVFRILGELFHIPKHLRWVVLDELVGMGIIKRVGQDSFEVSSNKRVFKIVKGKE